MTNWMNVAVLAACLQTANAFLPQSTVKSASRALFAMPDQPFQDRGSPSSPPPLQRERRGTYQPEGKSYFPPREPGVMPDPTTVGPMERGKLGYGMEAREAFGSWNRRNRDNILQGGGTRKTWQTSPFDQTTVNLASDGRPIYTRAQVWEGPTNVPASMTLYSEDGAMQPWMASFQNKGRSSVLDVRNTGPVEFPVNVAVVGQQDGTKGMPKAEQDAVREYVPSPEKVTQTVQGGSLKYFNVKAGVSAVMVELFSEGRPMYANVELWQGPGNIKQCAQIYSDNGNDRVWNAVIETHGRECTVAVRNIGPGLVYPFEASVDPLY